VLEHTGASVRVATETDGPALLVLTENRSEGWMASIDGSEPLPTLPCNVTWQAVVVPEGQHEVLFVYEPAAFRWGLRFSLAAAALLLLMLLLPRHLG
jgi:hypothetical protein